MIIAANNRDDMTQFIELWERNMSLKAMHVPSKARMLPAYMKRLYVLAPSDGPLLMVAPNLALEIPALVSGRNSQAH